MIYVVIFLVIVAAILFVFVRKLTANIKEQENEIRMLKYLAERSDEDAHNRFPQSSSHHTKTGSA